MPNFEQTPCHRKASSSGPCARATLAKVLAEPLLLVVEAMPDRNQIDGVNELPKPANGGASRNQLLWIYARRSLLVKMQSGLNRMAIPVRKRGVRFMHGCSAGLRHLWIHPIPQTRLTSCLPMAITTIPGRLRRTSPPLSTRPPKGHGFAIRTPRAGAINSRHAVESGVGTISPAGKTPALKPSIFSRYCTETASNRMI